MVIFNRNGDKQSAPLVYGKLNSPFLEERLSKASETYYDDCYIDDFTGERSPKFQVKDYDTKVISYGNNNYDVYKYHKVQQSTKGLRRIGGVRIKDKTEDDIKSSRRRYAYKVAERIRELALANQDRLTHFVTLTFAKERVSSRYDYDDLSNKVKAFLKAEKKKYGNFDYIIVSEYHKDKAIHFHAMLGAGNSSVLNNFVEKIHESDKRKVFRWLDWDKKFGNPGQEVASTVLEIEGKEGARNTGLYVSKYIKKSFNNAPTAFSTEKKMYWRSTGLNKPEKYTIMSDEVVDLTGYEPNATVEKSVLAGFENVDGKKKPIYEKVQVDIYNFTESRNLPEKRLELEDERFE